MILTKLEDLPDEILIEICLYLTSIDTINVFGQLNSRLEQTITQFRYDIHLQYLTLDQFQQCCSHLIPYNAEYIVKLTLNGCYAPGAISCFNKSIVHYNSVHDFLPSLKQLWLINFNNNDIDILPKILSIEKVMIDIDGQISLLYSTRILLDRYLFCTSNTIKELRLCDSADGIGLQHDVPVTICPYLEKLMIDVTTLDDLILIFRRAPYLKKLHVTVNLFSTTLPKQHADIETIPKHISNFHLWLKDERLLSFYDLYNILTCMPTIERLSLEIQTYDIQYGHGYRWKELISKLPKLSRIDLGLKIWLGWNSVPIDIISYFETFVQSGLEVCCYADEYVLFIDTIPYEFDTEAGLISSPYLNKAKATNMTLFKRRSRKVHSISFNGRHQSIPVKDWLDAINRFPAIQILDIGSINLCDQKESQFIQSSNQLRLPNLSAVRYIRSTKCQVNIPFFIHLANNTVAPRLHILMMMYGDLIYLCKRLPIDFRFKQFKQLSVYNTGVDGRICLKDTELILKNFPNLEYFWLHVQSSRTVNRTAKSMTEAFLRTLPNLISFRLSCKRGSLRLALLHDDDDACLTWIKRACGFDNQKQVHFVIEKRQVTIWK